MMKFAKYTLLSAAIAVAPFVASTSAMADDYYYRRHHHNGDAVALGALGLATGVIVGSAIASQPRTVYVEPDPVYVEPEPVYVRPAPAYVRPAPAYVEDYPPAPRRVYNAGVEPWTPEWYDYCSARYRSFNARTGTYVGYDGRSHFCTSG
ncbi:BA14K family protein [Rhizobium cremeum]|uniref:BA14K family protein n=1 Tax=Rhizobium cremeum TaxID=2813827 RepID=UPI000DDCF3E9|nr:BA14K family protein [Rhizobium cremeum]MCJ7993489.1 BA14K family protein [Rhizobium cremeum]MCJ7998546.1 BA14K family protein [Rhizobium cremeum]